jgi:hypothetical protein
VRHWNLVCLALQAAPTAADRLAHVLKAQHYATLTLATSLTAAGAKRPLVVPTGNDTTPAEGALLQPTDSTVAAASGAAADGPQTVEMQHPPVPEAPSNTITSVTSALSPAAAAAAVASAQGLITSDELPSQLLGWAHWQPTPTLLAALAAAAGTGVDSNSSKLDSAGLAQLHATARTAGEAKGLGSCALQVPELLLAHLQLLVGSLQESGQHLLALPVLQLARLVALLALDSQVKWDCTPA